jgi:uncharacterized membrane protein YcjF (UPF0283 family)
MTKNADTLRQSKERLCDLLRFGIASFVIKERERERELFLIDSSMQENKYIFPPDQKYKDQDADARKSNPNEPVDQLEQVIFYGEQLRAQVEEKDTQEIDEEIELTMEILEQEMESLKSHFLHDTTQILERIVNILTCWNESLEWTKQQIAYDGMIMVFIMSVFHFHVLVYVYHVVLMQLYQHLWASNDYQDQEKYHEVNNNKNNSMRHA